jgi:asparagine synthase (glutamine-hydrolysing)
MIDSDISDSRSARANSMFRRQGTIDVTALGPAPVGALPVETRDDIMTLRAPGLDIHWRRGCADVGMSDGVLGLAAGEARDDATDAGGEAARWIERYHRHGEQAAAAVGGGFAVLIVDFRRRKALLFVDRFSIETMCYRAGPGHLAFADTACDVPGGSRQIDSQALYDYLYFHMIPAPGTAYRDVLRLEAAHRLTVTTAEAVSSCYWMPAFVENDRRHLADRKRAFVEAVRACVAEEAGDVATACFLSGGTDSSTVCGMLARLRDEPVHAYSIGFDAEGYDEMEYARIAARHFGLVHHEYYVTPDDLVDAIPKVAASFDQPFGNSSILPAYLCAMRAKEDGFARMLAGDGGDELFAGNSRYALQKVLNAYGALPRSFRGRILEPVAHHWSPFRRVPGLRQIGGYVRHASVPMPDRLESFNLLKRLGEERLLDPDFRATIDARLPLERQRATWNAIEANSLLNRMLAYDWIYTLADNDIPKVRYATRLAGVGVGYPFLGRALTDLSLALPTDWKLKGLRLRWFFKDSLRDFLPKEILRKKKHGFGLPFGHWLLRHQNLRGLAEASLQDVARRGIVRHDFTDELLSVLVPQAPGYYGEIVWLLMMLEQWFRSHDADFSI